MKIAIATATVLPHPDTDQSALVAALERRGASVRVIAWDDPNTPPLPDEIVVVRSTWNYIHHLEAFLRWVEATAATTRLFNPASVIRANAQKTYLRDLEARGIAIVPTRFLTRGSAPELEGPWPLVIKPVVSAGSLDTKRFEESEADAARQFLATLLADRDVMVQPWMPTVATTGERCLVTIAGAFTHAVRKAPRFASEPVSVTVVPIADDERAFAERVLACFDALLYARVDILRDEAGTLRLMELELIEPFLFLEQHPPAIDRFADAILAL